MPVLLAVAAAGLLTGFSVAWIGLHIGGLKRTRDVDDAVTALAALIAAALCARAGVRHHGRMRVFWTLLAGACLCWSAAEITWGVYDVIMHVAVPVPSWADVGYLSAIPVAILGLLSLPAIPRTARLRIRWLLDSLIVATSLAFLSWGLVLGPVWHSTDLSTLGGVVALAYPFGDVMMVFFIILALRRMTGGETLALWFLFGGLLLMALSDSTYSYLTTTNSYSSGGLIDVGWIAAYLMIGLAGFASDPSRATVTRAAAARAPSLTSFFAPFVPAFMALATVGIKLQLGDTLDTAATAFAFGLIVLVLVRQALLARELMGAGDTADAGHVISLIQLALGRDKPRTAQAERL